MKSYHYHQLLNSCLRAQTAYALSSLGWALTEHLGWRSPHAQELWIQEMPLSEVNVILELDHDQQLQWISVRGSSNLKNWLLNIQYIQRFCDPGNAQMPCGGIDIHRGFRAAATEVFQDVLPRLHPRYPIHLTGHSLGGAIASILTLFLTEIGYPVEQCITFGQPMITDRAGANLSAHIPLIRVVHDDDIVPHLPPMTPLTFVHGGYQHFGEVVHLQDSRLSAQQLLTLVSPQLPYQTGFWKAMVRSLLKTNTRMLSDHIGDHALGRYLQSLLTQIEVESQSIPDLPAMSADLHRSQIQVLRQLTGRI